MMKRWQFFTFAVICFTIGVLSATVYEGVAQDGRSLEGQTLYAGFYEKLDLSESQRVRLDEIIEEATHQMVDLSQETRPRLWAIKRQTREQIRGFLNEEQLVTFNAICESCDRRKRKR